MRGFLTGHHGYIGSVLALVLRQAGHDVVGLDIFYYLVATSATARSSSLRSSWMCATRAAELAGFDAVVNYAALSNDPLGDLNASWTSLSTATAP